MEQMGVEEVEKSDMIKLGILDEEERWHGRKRYHRKDAGSI